MVSTKNVDCLLGSSSFYLKSLFVAPPRFKVSSNLAALGIAPGVHLSIRSEGKRVMRARHNLDQRSLAFLEHLFTELDG